MVLGGANHCFFVIPVQFSFSRYHNLKFRYFTKLNYQNFSEARRCRLNTKWIYWYYNYSVIINTSSTLKMAVNLTQILNFKANFHLEFELFFECADNGGHFMIVGILKKKLST